MNSELMKARLGIMAIYLCCCTVSAAQMAKSFVQMEVLTPSRSGPITDYAGNVALWAEWIQDESYMEMLDGTKWKYDHMDSKGECHYKFVKSLKPIMPGTTYHEAVVSCDKTKIVVIYTFGFGGYYTKMYATYGYIGEGKQPAVDYIIQAGERSQKLERNGLKIGK